MRGILPLALMLSLLSGAAGAADYYVAAEKGHDSDSGSREKPFETIMRGVQALSAGDTLHVESGVYYEPVVIAASGTEPRPITILGEGSTRPVIKNLEDAVLVSGSYIVLAHLEAVSLGEGSAISIGKGNHHVTVADSIARDSGCGGIAAQQADYLTIEDNLVYGNGQRSPYQCSGISIYQAKEFDGKPGFHSVIRRNVSYGNMNLVVDDSITHSGGKTTDGNGIIIDDSRNTQGSTGNGPYRPATLVENNLVFDNGGRGIQVFLSDNVLVRHNTAYLDLKDPNLLGPRNGEISVVKSGAVTVVGNLAVVRDKKSYGLFDGLSNGDAWDFNLTFGGESHHAQQSDARWGERNVFDMAPRLAAPGSDPATADFHPLPDSPLFGHGSADNRPAEDLDGRPRGAAAPAIGAYESSEPGTVSSKF